MLLEFFGFEGDARVLHVVLGGLLGLIFGVAAQISRFCIRRAVAGEGRDGAQAGAVWITALAVAIAAFIGASVFGLVDLAEHRFWSLELPVVAILIGGLMFGSGMILTRGCISRLTVLSATGNLRAALVLVVFAIVAHATLKGVLAPARVALGSITVDLPFGTLLDHSVLAYGLCALAVAVSVALIRVTRPAPLHMAMAVVIGLLPVVGWAGTSVLLLDEFDPQPVQSIAFTLPFTDSLFWIIASSAIPATFGVGLVGGVLAGSFVSAAARGELALQSFDTGSQTVRYLSGAALMGVGGVLAGGCTVGAGLAGAASLSIAALLALVAIVVGGIATNFLMSHQSASALPAE
ncbi:MAG: YeeE/YedE family protein [Rhodobacteraceae bacterium]|nr:YeeE/YedE family protein [Paracoccaceae bacterium]